MEYLSDILVAVITGGMTLVGVIASNNKKQAIIETRLENLTQQVEKHNSVIERTYKLETKTAVMETRLNELENAK